MKSYYGGDGEWWGRGLVGMVGDGEWWIVGTGMVSMGIGVVGVDGEWRMVGGWWWWGRGW